MNQKIRYITIALLLLSPLFMTQTFAAGYPPTKIKNNTPYHIIGTVEYASAFCKNDSFSVSAGKQWRSKDRGICLITAITGKIMSNSKNGEKLTITPYHSTGTSYAQFYINAYGDRYRIFSDHEYKKVRKRRGMSPGFKLVNKTSWPIAYSLEQVGCLYHDVLPAKWRGRDGIRVIDTGAVWFTLLAHIQPDGINPRTDWDCAKPIAEITADVLLAVAETVATGGAAAPGAITQVVVKQVAKQAVKTAIKVSAKELSKTMVEKVGEYLNAVGTVVMGGQYAGYAWPFQCNQMPEYHITGGPILAQDPSGAVYLKEGTPLRVRKVNQCGNKMMPLSPKSMTAKANVSLPKQNNYPATPSSIQPNHPTRPSAYQSNPQKLQNQERICKQSIQGRVAWNRAGNRSWDQRNINRLCRNTRNARTTIHCFKNAIRRHNQWDRAIKACANRY